MNKAKFEYLIMLEDKTTTLSPREEINSTIDDPVQTIDAINVWGFIETLRYEFHDYQLLFLTHEVNNRSYLCYKLSKMGISTEYRDMLIERNRQYQGD